MDNGIMMVKFIFIIIHDRSNSRLAWVGDKPAIGFAASPAQIKQGAWIYGPIGVVCVYTPVALRNRGFPHGV